MDTCIYCNPIAFEGICSAPITSHNYAFSLVVGIIFSRGVSMLSFQFLPFHYQK